MGLLDDLKKQADSLRKKQHVTQAELKQNLQLTHVRLKDGLQYLIDLFNSLNIVKPVVSRHYYVEGGVTKLENLLQCDYSCNARRLSVDHYDYIEAIVLRFRCVGDGKITIEKVSDPMVQRLRDHLWTNALKFDVKEVKNERGFVERGIFTLACEVPVTITIAADPETTQIRIVTKNLEKLGEYVYLYDFDEFGKPVLEELGKAIIAKPNTFRTTGKHQQAMTTSSARAQRADADIAQAQPAVEGPESADNGFLSNLKSFLKR